jgi:hypothetical protein
LRSRRRSPRFAPSGAIALDHDGLRSRIGRAFRSGGTLARTNGARSPRRSEGSEPIFGEALGRFRGVAFDGQGLIRKYY